MNTEQRERKKQYDKKWREEHPGYDAERARKYREKFIANHVCTCLNCGKQFPGYRASYCSPECQTSARKRASRLFSQITRKDTQRRKFKRIVAYVEKYGLKTVLSKIPRSDDSDLHALQSYIRRNNLAGYIKSIPRTA